MYDMVQAAYKLGPTLQRTQASFREYKVTHFIQKINLLWRLGGKNRLAAREQGPISEKCRYSVTAERLLVCRSMERRDSCYWKRYYYPENNSNMLKKKFIYQPNSTALNLLAERTTEAERGFERRFNSLYRWQSTAKLS